MPYLSAILPTFYNTNLVKPADKVGLPQLADNVSSYIGYKSEQDYFKFDKDTEIDNLKNEFQDAQDARGIFGKIYNGIKNLFGTKYSSKKINKAVEVLSSASTEEEVRNVQEQVEQYKSKQALAVDAITMAGTSIAIFSGGAKLANSMGKLLGRILSNGSIPANGKLAWVLSLIGGMAIGAVANVCLHQVENMTDNIDKNSWHNDEKLGEEISSGALSGLILTLYVSISTFVSNPIKKAFGLNAQDVLVAKNGTAKVAKTAMITALADGASGTAASTVISDGKYLINCATDEETEFSWSDLAQTTIISSVTGAVVNSIFGTFKGLSNAKAFNKELTQNQAYLTGEQAAKEVCSGKNSKNPKDIIKKNCQSCVKRKIKSEFKQRLKVALSKKPKATAIRSVKKPEMVFVKNNTKEQRIKN